MPASLPDAKLAWLQLARCEGVGPITFAALLERHGGAAAALKAVRREPAPGGGGSRRVPDRVALEAELAALAAFGGRIVTGAESDYPPPLRPLPDAPPAISVRGDVGL